MPHCHLRRHSAKQGCAKIPKRSGIQDPQDPRSMILMDLRSNISGFVAGSCVYWILHAHFVERSWWILDPAFLLCRGILGILNLAFPRFRGSWGSWILMLCYSVGSKGSWIPFFTLHVILDLNLWLMHKFICRCTSLSYMPFLCISLYLLNTCLPLCSVPSKK